MTLVSTSQPLLPNSGEQLSLVVVQVGLHVIVATQGLHHKHTALVGALLGNQAAMLEYLEAKRWRSPIQGHQIHPSSQTVLQQAPISRLRANIAASDDPVAKENRDIKIAQSMCSSLGDRAKQVHGSQVFPARQQTP